MEDKNSEHTLIQIASFDNYLLANMSKGLLEENNIFCHLKDENIVTIDPLLSPAVGGIKLMVQSHKVDEAKGIIRQAEEEYIAGIECPKCKNNALEIFEKTNNPTSFGKRFLNQIMYGQTSTYSKKYRCKNCYTIFNEIPFNNE